VGSRVDEAFYSEIGKNLVIIENQETVSRNGKNSYKGLSQKTYTAKSGKY
jgi:hypothetical protein